MKILYSLFFCILFLGSCNGRYKFWEISRFNIVRAALADNEPIKLLYSSRGPDNNENMEYFIHIVAVSQKTGDTVNILTVIENGFSIDDKDKVFNYFDEDNVVTRTVQPGYEKIKYITKVARDPKFDNIADNKYPTVIGSIGTSSQ